ncbi:hypothetical protein ABE402_06045 [Bacillus smithii]|uniref:hypothetical protein n=1 Tax=Bacillus smithii TaxID=1479 RepID=UPI003D22385F
MSRSAQERANDRWDLNKNELHNSHADSPSVTAEVNDAIQILNDFYYPVTDARQEIAASVESGGDEPMSDNGYITEKDLIQLKDNLTQRMDTKFESLRNEMDLKFESTNNKIDSLRNEMDLKFENQYLKIEKLLNEKFNIQKEKQAANTKWIIGTFGMGLLSIAVAIILHFV